MPDEPNTGALNDGGSGQGDTNGGTTNSEADIRAELEATFKQKLEEALANDGAYKAMQRTLAKHDTQLKGQIDVKEAEIANLKRQLDSMSEGFDWMGNTLIAALPPDQRAKVEAELQRKQLAKMQRETDALREELKNPKRQEPAQQDDFNEQLQAILAEAKESLEDTVRSHGLDPREAGLDYGSEQETFAARLKKLNASIAKAKKAKEDADVNSVRQRVPNSPTRTSGGSVPGPDPEGKTLLKAGADDLWERIRNGDFDRKNRGR